MIEHRTDCASMLGESCDCLPPETRERQKQGGRIYAAVVVFVTLVAVGVLNVLYTQHVDAQAERRNVERTREICGLIRVLDDAYQQTKPTTALGQNIADEIHAYRKRLGC